MFDVAAAESLQQSGKMDCAILFFQNRQDILLGKLHGVSCFNF
jgi:hypothetical protein